MSILNRAISFLCGGIFLCGFATLQKVALGAPLVLYGYSVPFIFGGTTGLLIGHFILKLKHSKDHLETLVKERTRALETSLKEIKTLKGIIPICSYCKKIRDDMDHWHNLEAYIENNSQANMSHGICPDCLRTHYPDIDNPNIQ
jgi:hypothetical protein